MTAPAFGPIRQLGYLVRDLDRAIEAWMRDLRVGPWTKLTGVVLDATYRGLPTRVEMDLALGYRGALQIELIEVRSDTPSPYQHDVRAGRYGLHHVAHLSDRIGAEVEAATGAGLEVVFDIRMPGGGRYVYLQPPALGEHVLVELLEATPTMCTMFERGMAAAAAWDGRPAVTTIDLAAR